MPFDPWRRIHFLTTSKQIDFLVSRGLSSQSAERQTRRWIFFFLCVLHLQAKHPPTGPPPIPNECDRICILCVLTTSLHRKHQLAEALYPDRTLAACNEHQYYIGWTARATTGALTNARARVWWSDAWSGIDMQSLCILWEHAQAGGVAFRCITANGV